MAEQLDEQTLTANTVSGTVNRRPPTKEECSRLWRAIVLGDMEVVSTLISDGVDMNAIVHEEYKGTPLHISAQKGHNNIVKKLLSLDVTVDCVDHRQWTPLHSAASSGHNDIVSTLLSANAKIEARTEAQNTPLYLTAQGGHIGALKILLDAKAEIDCVCKDQCTPLLVAAMNGHASIVDTLLAHGANVNHVAANPGQTIKLVRPADQGKM